jgi:hypothetical protein
MLFRIDTIVLVVVVGWVEGIMLVVVLVMAVRVVNILYRVLLSPH